MLTDYSFYDYTCYFLYDYLCDKGEKYFKNFKKGEKIFDFTYQSLSIIIENLPQKEIDNGYIYFESLKLPELADCEWSNYVVGILTTQIMIRDILREIKDHKKINEIEKKKEFAENKKAFEEYHYGFEWSDKQIENMLTDLKLFIPIINNEPIGKGVIKKWSYDSILDVDGCWSRVYHLAKHLSQASEERCKYIYEKENGKK